MVSMGQNMFRCLVGILSPNPIFQSRGRKKQRPVEYQLAAFLFCYGQQGSDTLSAAIRLSIGHGTVHLYCKRVCRAIRELRPKYLKWPNPERREVIAQEIEAQSGLPKCVGIGDGSQFKLGALPLIDGEQFRSRKKDVSVGCFIRN